MVVPQNRWFITENPIKMNDLGVPPFKETPKSVCGNPNRGPIWELFEAFRQTEIFSAWQPLGPLLKVKLLVGYI